MNRLGKHFKSVRQERCISLGTLARLIGYKNIGKGANRINLFEQQVDIKEDLLMKLAEALSIDWLTVEDLIEKDRRQFFTEWNAWANEPITPHVVVRLIAAVYFRQELPRCSSSVEEAEDAAAAIAIRWKKRCCLVLSRRISVWFDEHGLVECRTEAAPGQPNSPFMKLSRGSKNFVLKTVDRETVIQHVSWPQEPRRSPVEQDSEG